MREQHGPEHQRHLMWAAMADLLDFEAAIREQNRHWFNIAIRRFVPESSRILAVAETYLGEQS